jgi:hypothetical protein
MLRLRRAGLFTLLALVCGGCALSGSHSSTSTAPPERYTLSGGGACVQLGNAPQPPFANIRVSHDAYLAHSEPEVAENPHNPLNLVGGSKFFTNIQHYEFKIGTYVSFDGGCTWTDGGVLPGFTNEALTSDVTFGFSEHNNVYVAVLDTDNRNQSGVAVSTSTDGGKTFGEPATVYNDTTGVVFSDKPWLAVDDTNGPYSGSLYVVWSYDYNVYRGRLCNSNTLGCPQEVGFAKSTDGGKTFSPVKLIEGSAPFCTNSTLYRIKNSHKCDAALGATPVVLPDGTIAVMYAYIDLSNTQNIATRILVVTSSDGGATWSAPVRIATVHDIPYRFPGENFRTAPLPAFAADPQTGQLYVAWSDERQGKSDIVLTTSTNKGKTWSAPVKVNDDPAGTGAQHFQQQLAVAPDGVVSVSYFSTQVDPQHRLIDTFLAQSTDHGKTFLPALRVTTQSWNPYVDEPIDFNDLGFIGDYQGLAADNQFVHPFWNDTRTGSQEIFTAAVPSAQP